MSQSAIHENLNTASITLTPATTFKNPTAAALYPPRRSYFKEEFDMVTAEYPPDHLSRPSNHAGATHRTLSTKTTNESPCTILKQLVKAIGRRMMRAMRDPRTHRHRYRKLCKSSRETNSEDFQTGQLLAQELRHDSAIVVDEWTKRLQQLEVKGIEWHQVHDWNVYGGLNATYFDTSFDLLNNPEDGLGQENGFTSASNTQGYGTNKDVGEYRGEENTMIPGVPIVEDTGWRERAPPVQVNTNTEAIDQSEFESFDWSHEDDTISFKSLSSAYWALDGNIRTPQARLVEMVELPWTKCIHSIQEVWPRKYPNCLVQEGTSPVQIRQHESSCEGLNQADLAFAEREYYDGYKQRIRDNLFSRYAQSVYKPYRFCDREGLYVRGLASDVGDYRGR